MLKMGKITEKCVPKGDFLRFWGVFVLESVFGFSFEAPEVPFLVSPKIACALQSPQESFLATLLLHLDLLGPLILFV